MLLYIGSFSYSPILLYMGSFSYSPMLLYIGSFSSVPCCFTWGVSCTVPCCFTWAVSGTVLCCFTWAVSLSLTHPVLVGAGSTFCAPCAGLCVEFLLHTPCSLLSLGSFSYTVLSLCWLLYVGNFFFTKQKETNVEVNKNLHN